MTKEQQFWNWFKKNETKYFFLNQIDDENVRENFLNDFLEHLHLYCDKLYVEIGGYPDEKQDLIITAEGNTYFFDKVESLIEQAPEFEHWNILAFKPAVEGGIIEYNNIKLDPEKMYFIPLKSKAPRKIDLRIYIDNYNPICEKDFLTASYLILDNILGEKSNALDIGYLEVENLPCISEREDLIEFNKLPKYIAWKKSKVDS